MEFLVSAPITFVFGVAAWLTGNELLKHLKSVQIVLTGDRLLAAWGWFLGVAVVGLFYYVSRVLGLEVSGSLDVVRVAFGYSMWLMFGLGMAAGTWIRR